MAETPRSSFRHLRNQDGSWDSICMRFFATAARANNESDLALTAQNHSCTPLFVAQQTKGLPTQGSPHFRRSE
jgi:hypothetical protein